MKKIYILALLFSALTATAQPQVKQTALQAITPATVGAQLEFLSSDYMEGRETIGRGGFMAADYIASMFRLAGLEPFGDRLANGRKTYTQDIVMVKTERETEQSLAISTIGASWQTANEYNMNTDFVVARPSIGKNISADLVFIGYGIVDDKLGYNELKGLDLKGKIAVRLTGRYPGHADVSSAGYQKFAPSKDASSRRYVDPRIIVSDKALLDAGALGVMDLISGTYSGYIANDWITNYPFYPNENSRSGSSASVRPMGVSIPAQLTKINISTRVLNDALAGSGIDLEKFETQVARDLKPQSRALSGKRVELEVEVKSSIALARNVLGMMRGVDTTKYIVIGAHYDHTGIGDGKIWNGADDNASGTVAVMETARALKLAYDITGTKPACNIVFAAWTGEERGLLGSYYFCQHFPLLKDVKLYVNYDMIARNALDDLKGNRIEFSYTDSKPEYLSGAQANMKEYGIDLDLQLEVLKPGQGAATDLAGFAAKGIPIMGWFDTIHADYHKHTDEFSKINLRLCTDVIRLGALNLIDAAGKN